jgi:small GTP-binding protein
MDSSGVSTVLCHFLTVNEYQWFTPPQIVNAVSKFNHHVLRAEMDRTDIKMVMVGNTNVGKTSIVSSAIFGTFSAESAPTLGASYSTKTLTVDSTTVRLQIWDTAGQEKYKAMTPMYFHNARVGVVVYSIAERDTFVATDDWIKSLKENADSEVVIFLVGNKTDLESERAVTADEGGAKAAEYHAEFMELSAKTGFGIQDLFAMIPRSYLGKFASDAACSSLSAAPLVEQEGAQQKSCC